MMEIIERYWRSLFWGDPTGSALVLLTAVGFAALLLFGGIVAQGIVKCKHGVIPGFLGMLIPLGVFLVCAASGEVYLKEYLPDPKYAGVAFVALGLLGTLLFGVFLSRYFLGTSWGGAFCALVLSYSAAYGSVAITQYLLDGFATGARTVETGRERRTFSE